MACIILFEITKGNPMFLSRLRIVSFFAFAFVLTLTSLHAAPETYVIDPGHSSVQFRIKHFFSKVTGGFQKFEGTIVYDADAPEKSEVKATIDVASVDTNQAKRDEHLRAPDFFDTAKYPKMTFVSKSWKKTGSDTFEVTGDLTLHGVTKPVVLTARHLGSGEAMKGSFISGWEVRGTLKRSDFGITTGGPAVGDEVDIEIDVEAKKS